MKNMKPIGVKSSSEEAGKPSVLAGDSIYYRHPQTGDPHHGTVAGIGKHGMLVDSEDGEEHRIHWDKYIAHKARAERKLTIVDRGEDGSIMEDESGKKVFVHGALEDYLPPSEPLEKALAFNSSADVVAAITRLREDQAAQFQGLCGAIAMMAERIGDTAATQQTMMAILLEARKVQDVSIHLPEGLMQKSEPASIQVDVHVPAQSAPEITIEAPVVHVEAPVIHIAAAEAPAVTVTLPEQAAPAITFSPTIDVHVPEATAPVVHVSIPPKKTVTEIERDRDGNITRATQQDID